MDSENTLTRHPCDFCQTSLSYLLILVTLTQCSQGLGFQYLPWALSVNPKSQRGRISSPTSAEFQPLCSSASLRSHNPERACVRLGSDGAVRCRIRPILRTISTVFPSWCCVAILLLLSGWMSMVLNAQSCDLLWLERVCKNVRYSSYIPVWPISHYIGSDESVQRTNTRLSAVHKSFKN